MNLYIKVKFRCGPKNDDFVDIPCSKDGTPDPNYSLYSVLNNSASLFENGESIFIDYKLVKLIDCGITEYQYWLC